MSEPLFVQTSKGTYFNIKRVTEISQSYGQGDVRFWWGGGEDSYTDVEPEEANQIMRWMRENHPEWIGLQIPQKTEEKAA